MNRPLKRIFTLVLSLAAAVLVGACGGGDSLPPGAATYVPPPAPPDTVAPTVAITSNVSAGTTATGGVTFTFTFSESVGSSFTVDDVVVTGGTKGTFTMASGTLATLVVTPAAGTTGTISASIAAGKFSDLAGNSNTVAPSPVQVAFDTRPKTQMSLPVTFDSAAVAYGLVGFGGAEDSSIAVDPTNSANMVAKVVRAAGSETYAGTTITAGSTPATQLGFSPKIPFNANDTRMSVRVWSPDAGIPVRLKVEDHADPTHSVESEVAVTTAAAWQTLTFNFAPGSQAAGTAGINFAYTYDKATIFFDFGRAKASSVQKAYYFDDVTFVPGTGGGGGGGGGAMAPTNAPSTVIPAGSIVIYSDAAAVAGFDSCPNWGQATVCVGEQTIAGNKVLKYSNLNYEGLDWAGSPQNVSSKTRLHMDFWSPDLTSVKVSIISAGKENAVTQALTIGSWNSVDIDLASYTVPDKAAIIQIKLESTTPGTLYVDNIYFWGSAVVAGCGTTTPTCAPTTVIPSGSTVIYSDAASVAGLDLAPDWGQGTSITRSAFTVAGNTSEKYVFAGAPFLYQGIDWSANAVNVSTKGTLHLDFFSSNISSVKVSLIGGGSENGVTKAVTPGSWNAIDIDMALFTSPDKTRIAQIKLEPATAGTLYVDNIYFYGTTGTGGGGGTSTPLVTFDAVGVTYTLTGFGGAENATVVTDPTGGTNKVAKIIKSATAELWAGTTMSTGANQSIATIAFSATAKTMTLRVYSPAAGVPIRLKVEDAADPTHSVETEAMTTVANAWETLTFNFANQAAGTAALNLAFTYNKASVFPNFGKTGAQGGGGTYYFDDLTK